jgi:hypothetical protein
VDDKTNPNQRDLDNVKDRDANPDPITGAPGSHPVGTGVGAAGVGAAGTVAGFYAGAALGAAGGPVGAVAGGVVGAVAGAIGGAAAGHAIAENIDPTVESRYWRDNYTTRPYYDKGYTYENDYAPAYQHGWTSRARYGDRTFDQAEPDLRNDWERTKDKSRLNWDKAKLAVRDAWDRVSDRVERAADDRNRPTTP